MIFDSRLAEYKYYDMDQVVVAVFGTVLQETEKV